MPLFLDRLPLDHLAVALPVLIAEPGLDAPPANAPVQTWAVDTGMSGDAFCWRFHLEQAGLDPDSHRFHRLAKVTTAVYLDQPVTLPIRKADIWLVSNLDAFRGAPHRIELAQGVVFRDELPPLFTMSQPRCFLGLRALRRARLRVELDLAAGCLSIWTPDS